jgi:hypothetical protein
MKITIPENINDINLLQYQRYHELIAREGISDHDRNIRKIQIFTGLKAEQVKMISSTDYAEIISLIDLALASEHEFTPTFFIEDVEFGFVPNLDKITAGEFIDIEKYQGSLEDLHKLMAVLFRPIKKKDVFNNYSIESYAGTEQFAEVMKLMPLSAVNGSLVFFSTLSNELLSYIQKFTNQEAEKGKKQASTFKSGGGMQPLTN